MKAVVTLTWPGIAIGLIVSLLLGVVVGIHIVRQGYLEVQPALSSALQDTSGSPAMMDTQEAERIPRGAQRDRVQPEREIRAWIARGDWPLVERWLIEQSAAPGNPVPEQLSAELLDAVRQAMTKHAAVQLRRVIRRYIDLVPDDLEALFLLADLQLMNGLRENTIETYFQILDAQPPAEMAARARREVDQLINVMDLEFKTRGAQAEREAFWQRLTVRYPASDFYRYQLAQALTAGGQWASASRVLAETGTVDVAQANLDALADRIAAAQNAADDISFTRDGDRLVARVRSIHGMNFALLVDTGATITSLSSRMLRRLGARRQQRNIRLQTASGIVDADLYEVDVLEVEGRLLEDLLVVELPVEIYGVDGLLGVDVLDQLPWTRSSGR